MSSSAKPTLVKNVVDHRGVKNGTPEKRIPKFHILFTTDDDGKVSAIVLNLPGAGSCGDTEKEALVNVKEAIRGVLEVYEDSQISIPWKDTSTMKIPTGGKEKWITLNG